MAHDAFPIDWMLSQEALLKHSLMIPGTSGYKNLFLQSTIHPSLFFSSHQAFKESGEEEKESPWDKLTQCVECKANIPVQIQIWFIFFSKLQCRKNPQLLVFAL